MKIVQVSWGIAALTIIILLSSCAIPRVTNDGQKKYQGIAAELQMPAPPRTSLHVVITHGMGHVPKKVDELAEFIQASLPELKKELKNGGYGDKPVASKVLRLGDDGDALRALRALSITGKGGRSVEDYIREKSEAVIYQSSRYTWKGQGDYQDITFHWIGYSWYLAWLKEEFGATDEQLWRNSGYLVNRFVKEGVMNKGFPDAVSYLNTKHRPVVQDQFLRCFNRIRHQKSYRDQLAFVSSSLGSRILLDSLKRDVRDSRSARRPSLSEDTSHLFMFANQIPLLGLGIEEDGFTSLVAARGRGITRMGRAGPSQVDDLTIVAFNDPSDLLTYHLDENKYSVLRTKRINLVVTNVEIRNPGFALWPLFRDPGSAHSRHENNRAVMRRVIGGHPDL